MADTARTRAALQALLADNTSGDISAQDVRDFLVSVMFPQSINGFRLTLTTGVPVTTSDVTGATTIYLTPYIHNCIGLFDGTSWETMTSAEVSLALGTLTSGKNYDVFAYDNSGTLTLELLAWTNDTTRATALVLQDGVYVKTGVTTRRYIGTIRTTSTTATEDSKGGTTTQVGGKRFVWNLYNQVPRPMAVIDTTDSWSYTTNTIRQANAASGNKVEWVQGLSVSPVVARIVANVLGASNASASIKAGVGLDSVTAYVTGGLRSEFYNASSTILLCSASASYEGFPGIGYHYAAWCESGGQGTSTFYGDNAGDNQSGLFGSILG